MTCSTDERRAARSSPRGTSNTTPFSASVRLARTIRWAMVGSGTRKARAISSVVRPPRRRSVSATRASVESTGWQETKTRRSKASPMASSIAAAGCGAAGSCRTSISRPSSVCVGSSRLPRRSRSTAWFLAAVMSQAPGLSGTPVSGHFSSAVTSASCASSSARPTSPTIRASRAMSLADSIRQTAWIAPCVSDEIMGADQNHLVPARKIDGRAGPRKAAPVEDAPLHRHLFDRGGDAMDDGKKRPQDDVNETVDEGIEAERDVENYRDEYERAEGSGRSRSAGDLETDLEGKNDDRL